MPHQGKPARSESAHYLFPPVITTRIGCHPEMTRPCRAERPRAPSTGTLACILIFWVWQSMSSTLRTGTKGFVTRCESLRTVLHQHPAAHAFLHQLYVHQVVAVSSLTASASSRPGIDASTWSRRARIAVAASSSADSATPTQYLSELSLQGLGDQWGTQ